MNHGSQTVGKESKLPKGAIVELRCPAHSADPLAEKLDRSRAFVSRDFTSSLYLLGLNSTLDQARLPEGTEIALLQPPPAIE